MDLDDYTDHILRGDCLDVMAGMPDESVDLVVTDPPFGLKFMSSNWDKAVPSVDIWKQCLRVLKPGAFAFVMSIPRADCQAQMVIRLQEAGFDVSFTPLHHTFATGFPKAGNVGKLIDRRSNTEREVIGHQKITGQALGKHKGLGLVDSEHKTEWDITTPSTPEAQALDGSYCGWQPKPALEIILCAMRPLSEKTYIDQAMANGKGITWLDSGRIPYKQADLDSRKQRDGKNAKSKEYEGRMFAREKAIIATNYTGRFPANLLVSDDVLNDGRERISGIRKVDGKRIDTQGMGFRFRRMTAGLASSGSFSRYFSLDAWWEKKLTELPESVQKTFPFLLVPKATRKERNEGLGEFPPKQKYKGGGHEVFNNEEHRSKSGRHTPFPSANNHPTVKPVRLMSYLITIGSREGDVILDPFCGSGTTGVAAALLNRRFVGIELDEEYMAIAEARFNHAMGQIQVEVAQENRQLTLFEKVAD